MKQFKLKCASYIHDQPLLLVSGGGRPVRPCLNPPITHSSSKAAHLNGGSEQQSANVLDVPCRRKTVGVNFRGAV